MCLRAILFRNSRSRRRLLMHHSETRKARSQASVSNPAPIACTAPRIFLVSRDPGRPMTILEMQDFSPVRIPIQIELADTSAALSGSLSCTTAKTRLSFFLDSKRLGTQGRDSTPQMYGY